MNEYAWSQVEPPSSNKFTIKETKMNKKYTKKQITEAIAYWEKQLKAGNYKKVNESDGMKKVTFTDYIEYDEDDFKPGDEWKATRNGVIKNIKKHYPDVAMVKKIRTLDGGGLEIYSNNVNTLKKVWIDLSTADDTLDKLLNNPEKLEHELQASDFYSYLKDA